MSLLLPSVAHFVCAHGRVNPQAERKKGKRRIMTFAATVLTPRFPPIPACWHCEITEGALNVLELCGVLLTALPRTQVEERMKGLVETHFKHDFEEVWPRVKAELEKVGFFTAAEEQNEEEVIAAHPSGYVQELPQLIRRIGTSMDTGIIRKKWTKGIR